MSDIDRLLFATTGLALAALVLLDDTFSVSHGATQTGLDCGTRVFGMGLLPYERFRFVNLKSRGLIRLPGHRSGDTCAAAGNLRPPPTSTIGVPRRGS